LEFDVLIHIPGGEICQEVIDQIRRHIDLLTPADPPPATYRSNGNLAPSKYEETKNALAQAYNATGKSIREACRAVGLKESVGRWLLMREGIHKPKAYRHSKEIRNKIRKWAKETP